MNFKFDEKTIKLITELKEENASLASNSDVIKTALNLLKYVIDARKQNKKIIIKDDEKNCDDEIII